MLQTLKNAWNTKDIRSKIIFTLFIILLYRVGTVIPVPFVEANDFAQQFSGTILDYLNTLSGGSLGTATLFALGVSPYINASIIIQLLAVVFPKLAEIGKNDKKKMNFITRITTVVLAIVTAIGYYFLLKNGNMLSNAATEGKATWLYAIAIIVCYVAGATLIMWLAERINEKGIGNGISLILFANIISSVPSFAIQLGSIVVDTYKYENKAWLYAIVSTLFAILLLAVIFAFTVFVIWITGSERRIPVQYAKQIVSGKQYGGARQYIPLKVNAANVMPIIFAQAIMFIPLTFINYASLESAPEWVRLLLDMNSWLYNLVFAILIIAFTLFYTAITVNPTQMAEDIKRNNGFIPGVKPGKPTADYLDVIMSRITWPGALFLAVVAILPSFASMFGVKAEFAQFFGGTSLLILVGVVLDTLQQVESHLLMRHYDGLLSTGRIKGRSGAAY